MSFIGNTPTTQSFISGTETFNGTGAQTAYTLTRSVASVNDIQITINNVVQQPNVAYTVLGNVVTFTSAPSAGTGNIYVRYLSTTTQAITPSANTVGYNQLTTDVQNDLGISFKNRIINGDMRIDQRNAGASFSVSMLSYFNSVAYTADRWCALSSVVSKFTVQDSVAGTTTPPAGFSNYLGCVSSSAYSIGAGDYFGIGQRIEGYNTYDLAWGTVSAKTVTLSFWAWSSLTGTFGGALTNGAGNRSYPFSYSIPVANTWTKISITVAGDTTGTWSTTNGTGLQLTFGIGVGSTYSGTAGSWSGNLYMSSTGATSVVGTSGATFYITGVQLEVGTQATTFDYRDYPRELILCQRYYETSITGTAVANNVTAPSRMVATSFTNQSLNQNISFKVTKRAVPTINTYTASGLPGSGFFDVYIGGVWVAGTSNGITPYFNSFDLDFNVASSTTPNNSYITAGNWAANAEL